MRQKIILSVALCLALFCPLLLVGVADSTPLGDVDGDGIVTFDDAKLVFDYVAGLGVMTREQLTLSDIDGDGRVTSADAAQIFHFVSGVLGELPYHARTGGVLTLLTLPDKITYTAGEDLDLTGMKVVMSYFDGTSKEVTGYTVSGYESVPGTRIIVVSYEGMKTAFAVTVYPREAEAVEISSLPAKLTYSLGEELDLTGLVVTAYYSDGTSEAVTAYAVNGFTGEQGINTIKIQYGSHTLTFDVTVGG